MVERISGRAFLDAEGVGDWRVVWGGGWACAHFHTGSYAASVAFVREIGDVAVVSGRAPDVDLRPDGVTVRLFSGEAGGLGKGDVELARAISAAARELGARPETGVAQHVQVAIDALVVADVLPFWRAVLAYDAAGDDLLVDPLRRGPSFWFQQMDAPRPGRNRVHVDVYVAHDAAQSRLAAARAAGGRIVDDSHAPGWWTLADPEGNEVDVAIWMAP